MSVPHPLREIGLLVRTSIILATALAKTYYGPSRWAGHDAVMINARSITRAGVAAYQRAGLEVLHFRTNTERAWTRALRRNFDGIMTDRPDQLKAFCRR